MEWQVGKFKIQLVIRDWFRLDGGTLWNGGVPRDEWILWTGYTFQMNNQNKVRIPVNCFLIITPRGEKILVDVSIGQLNRWKKNTIERHGMENEFNLFKEGLEDPHFVVPTHLHFDHAGGCVKLQDGKLVPAFRNAIYLFHDDEFTHARLIHPKTRSSYLRENLDGLEIVWNQGYVGRIFKNKVVMREGVTLIKTRGHTPGHISVLIESEGQVAFIPGALLPTRYHGIIACGVGNDTHGLRAANHKIAFLRRAAKKNWLLLLEHDPGVAFRALHDKNGNYRLEPV